jgi:hypothetical protein
MEPHLEPTIVEAAPAPVAPVEEVPLPAPAEVDAPVAPVESVAPVAAAVAVEPTAPFSSLYHSVWGTLAAILAGVLIIIAIQIKVARIFNSAKNVIEALTYFATSMVAILVGIYVCDLLIAGPNVLLLREGERSAIVGFIKDTCLLVFAYFFGTKSADTSKNSLGG